jgi:transposase InsO family protein
MAENGKAVQRGGVMKKHDKTPAFSPAEGHCADEISPTPDSPPPAATQTGAASPEQPPVEPPMKRPQQVKAPRSAPALPDNAANATANAAALPLDDAAQNRALARHSAVQWVLQAISQGHSQSRALALAADLWWGGRRYSARTIEDWVYVYRARGFAALYNVQRHDKGRARVLDDKAVQTLCRLRRENPQITVAAIIKELTDSGVLEAGSFSQASVYRALQREGLDRVFVTGGSAVIDGPSGPSKAFESRYANALWMSDAMHGPVLSSKVAGSSANRAQRTYFFALIDDCSRLVPHGQYYAEENLRNLLHCLREAIKSRGIPEKLYTDQGKVFTCAHLQVVCANLGIRLLHARAYHAWSKGKIERFMRTVQQDFQARLAFKPVHSLEALNERFHQWLAGQYNIRPHSSLDDQTPSERFAAASLGPHALRTLEAHGEDSERLFLARATRRVRQDATISLHGSLWEVPLHLKRRTVELLYDPFQWSRVEVWHNRIMVGNARRCDKVLNSRTYSSSDYGRHEK